MCRRPPPRDGPFARGRRCSGARTQYDAESGRPISEARFYDETGWNRDLRDEIIIEAGSGSGHFTEHVAATGALVLSLDYSVAVEANYRSNGDRPNVLIVQGDIYKMPFRYAYADKMFCFGVLQHTPNPEGAFMALARHLKPGGSLVVDVYAKTLMKYVLRHQVLGQATHTPDRPRHALRWVRYVNTSGLWPTSYAGSRRSEGN